MSDIFEKSFFGKRFVLELSKKRDRILKAAWRSSPLYIKIRVHCSHFGKCKSPSYSHSSFLILLVLSLNTKFSWRDVSFLKKSDSAKSNHSLLLVLFYESRILPHDRNNAERLEYEGQARDTEQ